MSSSSSSAVRKQLTRALSLLRADARAAKVPLPAPFRSSFFAGEGEKAEEDRSSQSSSTSNTSSSSSSSSLLRAALGDDSNELDGARCCRGERGRVREHSTITVQLLTHMNKNENENNSIASFARLRRLREQVEFLASTPPDVRESLRLWRRLHDEHGGGGSDDGDDDRLDPLSSPSTADGRGALLSAEALAFERGSLLLPSVARPPKELELGGGWHSSSSSSSENDDDDVDDDEGGGGGGGREFDEDMSPERVSAALDDAALAASDALAAAAAAADNEKNAADAAGSSFRRLARLLFDGTASQLLPREDGSGSGSGRLFVVPRLRPAAVEWLYDGLGPLFPGAVLQRGQRLALGGNGRGGGGSGGGGGCGVGAGAPIALAAVASSIARRLGVRNVPVPAEGAASRESRDGGGSGSAAAAAAPRALPPPPLSPSVAARMAARTPAAAPETGTWLLACPLGEWVWDPATGDVVVSCEGAGGAAAEERWPSAGFRRRRRRSGGGGGVGGCEESEKGGALLLPRTSSDPRVGWAAMLRACVVAHTRRGDSDAVAAVLPQLLALDGEAPEWEQVLRESEVVAKR